MHTTYVTKKVKSGNDYVNLYISCNNIICNLTITHIFNSLGYVGVTAIGFYLYHLNCKKNRVEDIEMRSGRLALLPLLMAERDRGYLKQLKVNRDEEAKLMANVEGWEVGTWFGEPLFKTLPKDKLIDPMFYEFYVHTHFKHLAERAHLKLWN
jgi:NADH dehydrogenase (ubiquinone) 1 alpha subcomplex subunit 13